MHLSVPKLARHLDRFFGSRPCSSPAPGPFHLRMIKLCELCDLCGEHLFRIRSHNWSLSVVPLRIAIPDAPTLCKATRCSYSSFLPFTFFLLPWRNRLPPSRVSRLDRPHSHFFGTTEAQMGTQPEFHKHLQLIAHRGHFGFVRSISDFFHHSFRSQHRLNPLRRPGPNRSICV